MEASQRGTVMPDLKELEAAVTRAKNGAAEAANALATKAAKATIEEIVVLSAAVVDTAKALKVAESQLTAERYNVKTAVLAVAKSSTMPALVQALTPVFAEYDKLGGIERCAISLDLTGDKVIGTINETGPGVPTKPKGTRGGTGGGGARSTPLTVDGTEYPSANAALMAAFPDFEGKMGRTAIVSKLANAGHTIS